MFVLYFIHLIQAVTYTFILIFTGKHVYHDGVVHYPMLIMCKYIFSLLLFCHDSIACMLFIVGQELL